MNRPTPPVRVGDTVEVHYLIREGDKERVQLFIGTVIAVKGRGIRRSITVRRIVQGEGVERIFPLHSPRVKNVVVTRAGKVRRAKLYFLRDRMGKQTRVQELLGEKARREREFEKAVRASMAGDEEAAGGAPAAPPANSGRGTAERAPERPPERPSSRSGGKAGASETVNV